MSFFYLISLKLSNDIFNSCISEQDQAHLFERFFRARTVSTIQGTGLGLYIIARYLELMGGTIALHSVLEQGTTVTLTLPYENHPAD